MNSRMIEGPAGKLELLSIIPDNPKGSILFCHGICHAAWCWENFLPYFAQRNYSSYAVSYRSHGKSDKGFSIMRNYVEDVEAAIKVITDESGFKPHILGHSMGGAVVQKLIGEHSDIVSGAILFASATAPKMPFFYTFFCSWFIQHFRLANFIACFGKTYAGNKLKKSAFFAGGNVNPIDLERYGRLLQREPILVPFELFTIIYSQNYKLSSLFPILVIGSKSDLYFPKKSINKTAKAYRQKPVILNGICHDMMLDIQWEKTAEYVFNFLENNPCKKKNEDDLTF